MGDALAIPHSAHDGSKLDFVTNKAAQRVCWPVSSSLKEVLDGTPKHEASTLAPNSYGQTWTDSGFRGPWGIKTTAERLARSEVDAGEALLSHASDIGADLIVMGAYGHGRLREFILRDATRTILQSMTVPVLMSH